MISFKDFLIEKRIVNNISVTEDQFKVIELLKKNYNLDISNLIVKSNKPRSVLSFETDTLSKNDIQDLERVAASRNIKLEPNGRNYMAFIFK